MTVRSRERCRHPGCERLSAERLDTSQGAVQSIAPLPHERFDAFRRCGDRNHGAFRPNQDDGRLPLSTAAVCRRGQNGIREAQNRTGDRDRCRPQRTTRARQMGRMLSSHGFIDHVTTGALASVAILAVPMILLIVANWVFRTLAPADFNQVSIVRRAGVIGGTLLGAAAVLAPVFSGKGLGFSVLAGSASSGMLAFCDLLGSRLAWLLPANLLHAPAPAFWLVLAGAAAWLLPTVSAARYWNGRERIGAMAIAILLVPFMAFSLVYAFTMVVWFVHLLNIWSIAVAGLIYQRYRNSQLGHG
jgi:hypothetical protein